MIEYPYNYSLVLTDTIFVMYGGQIGSSTSPQREIAYILAEEQMTEHLNTFLTPTIVTGSHYWAGGNPFVTDYGHITRLLSVGVSSVSSSCEVNLATGSCGAIRNAKYGYVDVAYALNCGGCGNIIGLPPYNVRLAYESGFTSGTTRQPTLRLALVLAAQIALNFMDISLSNEGVADIGIQNFSNQSYSEARARLGNSVFGNSAMAQKIKSLTNKYRSRPSASFH